MGYSRQNNFASQRFVPLHRPPLSSGITLGLPMETRLHMGFMKPTTLNREAGELHHRDSFEWTVRNAALRRAARFADADIEHIAEPIKDIRVPWYIDSRAM